MVKEKRKLVEKVLSVELFWGSVECDERLNRAREGIWSLCVSPKPTNRLFLPTSGSK